MSEDRELELMRRRIEMDPEDEDALRVFKRALERRDGVKRKAEGPVVPGDAVEPTRLVVVDHEALEEERREEEEEREADEILDAKSVEQLIALAKVTLLGFGFAFVYMISSAVVILFVKEEGDPFWGPLFEFLGQALVTGGIITTMLTMKWHFQDTERTRKKEKRERDRKRRG